MRLPEELEEGSTPVNIVPMIDVIFAILTFFIMSSLYLTRLEGVPVNLPKAITGEIQKVSPPMRVTINQKGELFVNDKGTDLGRMMTQIRLEMGGNQSLVVVINADEKVEHGRVIEVMDKLRMLPGVKIGIGTQKPSVN